MPWWNGPTVLDVLDAFHVSHLPSDQPLRFPIQDVYRFDERRILAGRIESGTLKVGDRLLFSPGNKTSTVKTVERWNAPSRDVASAGESVGVTLTEQIFVERGSIASHEVDAPYELNRFVHARNSFAPREGDVCRAQRSRRVDLEDAPACFLRRAFGNRSDRAFRHCRWI
jgi:sulfate adenylyltransferase subunit 1 (EFTu-like GTPase family)